MKVPSRLGDACWTQEGVTNAISRVAQVSDAARHYFLASHSPVEGVRNTRTDQSFDEEALFSAIFAKSRPHTVAVVCGSPGTGKSHLIHWLKLRLDAEQQSSRATLAPILVKRRTGSLKDALEQIIEQLPAHFSHHLSPLQSAVDNISHDEARERLADAMALEISYGRGDQDELPYRLRNLEQIFRSPGFRDWLCRDDGTIDRHIKRLVGESEADEREDLPQYDSSDFLPTDRYRRKNTEDVEVVIEEFEDDASLCQFAANFCNALSRGAIRRVSGLAGTDLRRVLGSIRSELNQEGKGLALFLEDVSVMSALDRDVVHAVEPGADSEGRLVAVLGMTDAGIAQIPQNLIERFDFEFSIDTSVEAWRESTEKLAGFTARYLNVVRTAPGVLRAWAEGGLDGTNPPNACDSCDLQEQCHEVFGSWDMGPSSGAIGMFPLSPDAPRELLDRLDTRTPSVRANPRGFLENVLRGLLEDPSRLDDGMFPSLDHMPVRVQEPEGWAEFERKYLGGFSTSDRERVRVLSDAWFNGPANDYLANRLEPILSPLQLPKFAVEVAPQPESDPTESGTPPQVPPSAKTGETSDEFQGILSKLRAWLQGETLLSDEEPRRLISELLLQALPMESVRGVPRSASSHLAQKGSILIDGQRAKVQRGRFAFSLDRSEETRALIEALLRHDSKGGWGFPGGESHKRVVHTWLMKHGERALHSLLPERLDPVDAIGLVAGYLYVGGSAQRGYAGLEPEEVVATVFEEVEPERYPSNHGDWPMLLKRIHDDRTELREFLRDELAARQGTRGGSYFLDPLPVIDAISKRRRTFSVESISEDFRGGYWKKRFQSAANCMRYPALDGAVAKQFSYALSRLSECSKSASELGYSTRDRLPAEQIAQDALKIREELKSADHPIPDPAFDDVVATLRNVGGWDQLVQTFREHAKGDSMGELVQIDFPRLEIVCETLRTVGAYLHRVEAEVSEREVALDNTSSADREALFEAIDGLVALRIDS